MHLTKGQEVCERRRVPQRSHPFCAASIACALCQVAAKSEQVGRVGVHACILVHMHMPFSLVPVTCTPKAPPSTHVRAPRFGVRCITDLQGPFASGIICLFLDTSGASFFMV
eukprot:1145652-Pelagomonas_calceolata.AAC.2